MNNKCKHLTLDERKQIETFLNQKASFKSIGRELGRDCTTISKEVSAHTVCKRIAIRGVTCNNCCLRFQCMEHHLCRNCDTPRQSKKCRFCKLCNFVCPKYEADVCPSLQKAPHVCNGCDKRFASCTLEKHLYDAVSAHNEYVETLSESRTGLTLSQADISYLNELVSPLLYKKQSLHHICIHHKDSIMVSESTLYRLVDYNLFDARNIDLPRKVRYAKRKKKKNFKVDKGCRIGRNYEDFKTFCLHNPDLPITEMDSVEGVKGGKVLLTIHFKKAEFMLAFLRDANTSQSVINIFDKLYLELMPSLFTTLMPVLLGDNGSEFSNPKALEFDSQDNQRTHVFYCDPSAPHQKGSAERNHEFIRMFIPQGKSFDTYSQEDISLMMSHINSYARKSLGNKSPYETMQFLYGETVPDFLGVQRIMPDDVTLNAAIFKKEVN